MYTHAKYLFMKALALLDSSVAQNYIGYCFEEGVGGPKNIISALHWYELAANQGDMHGLANLGRFYEDGLGVKIDLNRAIDLYESAAQLDNVWAKNQLGCLLIKSDVYEKRKKAIYWFKNAVEKHDHSRAKLNLAWVYSEGIIEERSLKEAYRLTFEAAKQGEIEAQYNLGVLLLNGEGVNENQDTAIEWLIKANDNGFLSAHKLLKEIRYGKKGVAH